MQMTNPNVDLDGLKNLSIQLRAKMELFEDIINLEFESLGEDDA